MEFLPRLSIFRMSVISSADQLSQFTSGLLCHEEHEEQNTVISNYSFTARVLVAVSNIWVCKWNSTLFIMLYKVVLTFESVDEILKCDHSNESYWAVLSCGTVYYAVQGGSKFWVCGWNPTVWPRKRKLLSNTFCGAVSYTRWF